MNAKCILIKHKIYGTGDSQKFSRILPVYPNPNKIICLFTIGEHKSSILIINILFYYFNPFPGFPPEAPADRASDGPSRKLPFLFSSEYFLPIEHHTACPEV